MLSDVPRQQLAAIYVLNSRVADDDKLCEAYLRDYCGENRREIAALAAAVRWGVPKSLREGSQVPAATLRANLARRLEENQGLDPENAFWAVDAWASVVRPPNSGWPQASPADRPGPAPAPLAPAAPPPLPASGDRQVLDWSQPSPPPALSPQYSPRAASAGVLSPPASVPNAPQPAYPQQPMRPAPQPMPGIPYTAAAAAFLAGEKSPELKAVQQYLKQQLKIRKPAALMEEIQAAAVAPGIAKNMVNRVRRGKALVGLLLGILILIAGFVMLGNGLDPQGETTSLGTLGFFVFAGGCGYSLWSIIRFVRFS